MFIRVRDAATGAVLTLADEEAHARLMDGTALPEGDGRVDIVSPEGRAGSIPSSSLAGAIRDGWRIETPRQATERRASAAIFLITYTHKVSDRGVTASSLEWMPLNAATRA